jgi:putative transposase
MCHVLQVSSSGYYDWRYRPLSVRAAANINLHEQIKRVHDMSDRTYGMPRIRAELYSEGMVVSRKRIARLMRSAGIHGVSRRRSFVVTTERNRHVRPAPDLVQRQFVANGINQLWVADMTYLPTWSGFLYLAVVIDVYSRKVVGWMFGEHMKADLVISALNMALLTRKPESVIHHSDQGSQYTSIAFGNRCREMNVRPSMGSVGDAYDNAMAESFFAAWNVNSLTDSHGRQRLKQKWPFLHGLKVGTTQGADIQHSISSRLLTLIGASHNRHLAQNPG